MATQWIEGCAVQRVSLKDGLVLDFDDYNELVISRPFRLVLPTVDKYPVEDVILDPNNVPDVQRPLLDFAGASIAVAVESLPESDSSFNSSSSTFTSSMCWKRREGSLRSARLTIRSNSTGTLAATSWAGLGSSRRMAAMVEAFDPPSKARRPVSIS